MLRRALLVSLLTLLALPIAAGARPTAAAARTCSLTSAEKKTALGPTYTLKLKARGTSCGRAKRVVKAFHACRHAHGKAGKCSKKARGYRCSEKRADVIPTQYDAHVICKKGSRRVTTDYEQFT